MEVKRHNSIPEALAESTTSLWIFNNSDLNGKRNRGQLFFTIGRDDPVTVFFPVTWIPLDLMTYGTVEDISQSNTLRELIRSGLVVILKQESAQHLLNNPKYAAEYDKVQTTINRGRESGTSDTTNISIALSDIPDLKKNPSIQNLINIQTTATAMGDSDALKEAIKETFPRMKADDFELLIKTCPNKSSDLYFNAVEALDLLTKSNVLTLTDLPLFMETEG